MFVLELLSSKQKRAVYIARRGGGGSGGGREGGGHARTLDRSAGTLHKTTAATPSRRSDSIHLLYLKLILTSLCNALLHDTHTEQWDDHMFNLSYRRYWAGVDRHGQRQIEDA